ncbi:MAG TPA: hypothetical protein VF656_20565 [Pyrinomonadaceae bacterium]|jgi:hypothetical protein
MNFIEHGEPFFRVEVVGSEKFGDDRGEKFVARDARVLKRAPVVFAERLDLSCGSCCARSPALPRPSP